MFYGIKLCLLRIRKSLATASRKSFLRFETVALVMSSMVITEGLFDALVTLDTLAKFALELRSSTGLVMSAAP